MGEVADWPRRHGNRRSVNRHRSVRKSVIHDMGEVVWCDARQTVDCPDRLAYLWPTSPKHELRLWKCSSRLDEVPPRNGADSDCRTITGK